MTPHGDLGSLRQLGLLGKDLRHGWRGLRRRPAFVLVSVITLALGIGANTAIFSLIRGVVLRPLPYERAEQVVELWNRWEGSAAAPVAVPEYLGYRESRSFEALAAVVEGSAHLTGSEGEPERVETVGASADIFAVLGVEAQVGRVFTPAEDRPGTAPVVVLSHELWQRRFGGDPSLVGESITVDGEPATVLGALPEGVLLPHDYRSGGRSDLWMPLRLAPEDRDWSMHFLEVLGRLRDGVSLDEARAEMALVVDRMRSSYVSAHGDGANAISQPSFGVRLDPVLDAVTAPVRPALVVLLAAVLAVLLIACANVANLEMVRGELRRRELALRSALGAGRLRLLRQLLGESLLLAALGGGAGVLVGAWMLQLLVAVAPPRVPRLDEVRLDGPVLAFTFAVSAASGVLVGLITAWRMLRDEPGAALGSRRDGGPERRALAAALVVGEVALAVLLVVSAGLLMQSFLRLRAVDPGFETEHVLTTRLELPEADYPRQADVAAFFARLRERLEAAPEIDSAGGSTHLPLAQRRGDWNFYPEGRSYRPDEAKPRGDWSVVTPGYFESLGVALLAGRGLRASDDVDATPVLLVNRTLAETYWPGSSPVGSRVRLGGGHHNPLATIVGVVADARYEGLDRDPLPELYLPLAQAPSIQGWIVFRSLSLVVRTTAEPGVVAPRLRSTVAELDGDLPAAAVTTMSEVRAVSLSLPRFAGALVSSFAGLALLLGAVGVFGVLYSTVTRRRREIGVRMALGADRGRVARMVLGEGLRLTLLGLLLGALLAALGARLLAGLLYGVGAADPGTVVAVAVSLAVAGGLACWLPARRAAAVDPMRVLREE